MSIDRHNYEMYFLLYADRELDAPTAAAVEAFAAAHADLQEELQLLLQTRLTGSVQLDETYKKSLLRQLPENERLESLLLHLDGELNALATAQLHNEINTNLALRKQWELVQKTQLRPDTAILFPNKESLYRSNTPVHTLWQPWAKRMAAAAAVAIILLSAGWLLQNDNQTQHQMAATGTDQPGNKIPNNSHAATPLAQTTTAPSPIGKHTVATTAMQPANSSTTHVPTNSQSVNSSATDNSNPIALQTNEPTLQEYAETISNTTALENNTLRNSNIAKTENVLPVAATATTDIAYYTVTGTVALDGDAEADTESFGEALQRRSGVTGFLKKARRHFERRTGIQMGEGQIKIAAFAVSNN